MPIPLALKEQTLLINTPDSNLYVFYFNILSFFQNKHFHLPELSFSHHWKYMLPKVRADHFSKAIFNGLEVDSRSIYNINDEQTSKKA